MTWSRLGSSACTLILIACVPTTGGLGTASLNNGSETATDDGDSGSGDESQGHEGASAEGDGDPGDGDGDGDPGDGDGDPEGDGDPDPMNDCGNGIIEAGEECEGDDNGGVTCVDFGFVGGDMGCTGSCMHDITQCWNDSCGNGVTDEGEDCDGVIMDNDCIAFALGPGEVVCTNSCSFDFSDCGIEGEGDWCGPFTDCPNPGLYCYLFQCWDGSPGDECDNDGQCLSNDCDTGMFGGGECN